MVCTTPTTIALKLQKVASKLLPEEAKHAGTGSRGNASR